MTEERDIENCLKNTNVAYTIIDESLLPPEIKVTAKIALF